MLKKYTIKTSYSTETYICEDIEDFLIGVCFCDAYEVIAEEPVEDMQTLFEDYYNRIPKKELSSDFEKEFWRNNVCLLLSGYYETFEEMLKDNDVFLED